jgi:flagellar basal-body rod protein FlgB
MINDMFKDTYLLQKALDASWLNNKAINNNIANADTPGYKRQKVEFQNFLADAIDNNTVKGSETNKNFIPVGAAKIDSVNYKMTQDNSTSMREDGNNVDIESEMSQLAKNSIMYNALIQQISGKFSKLRSAIMGGGR